jgi:hypothetical protein
MANPLRLCLCLHNHQPIGNFDNVCEEAYRDSYLPFLDVFEPFDDLKIALHTSGCLLEWLDRHHPDYVDRLARLVAADRIEIIGGAFYESILTMIPSEDRVGQISSYTHFLEQRLGARVFGMWMPERVWEQSLTSDLAAAGIKYTILDDFHFKNAGLSDDKLHGYYLTEDNGRLVSVFPGSEQLRYLLPFGRPEDTITHLGQIAEHHPGAVVVFGDDGEKFGTWPDTKKHVYEDGWLARMFELFSANGDWLKVTTPTEAIRNIEPIGKIYLPEGSYREMTEWALPIDQQREYERLSHEMEHDPRWPRLKRFVRGGFWRNFKAKYAEADEMYARMMMVSRRLSEAAQREDAAELVAKARRELYRGQCNCSYWHGAFGGIYLPHLRNAVYRHLIAADNLLDQVEGKTGDWAIATANDYNLDGQQEICLASDKLLALIAPSSGGRMYELDVRSIQHNLLATIARRPEAYHAKVAAGANNGDGNCASIHDRVVFKQEGLDQCLQYDDHLRKSLIDHFLDHDAPLEAVIRGEAHQHGDFVHGRYETKLRRNPDRIQVQMTREGRVDDLTVNITKGVTLIAGSSTLQIAYLLEGLPVDRELHFAVEMNFAGLPAGADDRYFYRGDGVRLGQLGTRLDLADVNDLGLIDEWLGVDIRLTANQPSRFWTFPVETVSQSEGGFELVHQSVAVMPHWYVKGDEQGRWTVTMNLDIDTSLAETRAEAQLAEAVQ